MMIGTYNVRRKRKNEKERDRLRDRQADKEKKKKMEGKKDLKGKKVLARIKKNVSQSCSNARAREKLGSFLGF